MGEIRCKVMSYPALQAYDPKLAKQLVAKIHVTTKCEIEKIEAALEIACPSISTVFNNKAVWISTGSLERVLFLINNGEDNS